MFSSCIFTFPVYRSAKEALTEGQKPCTILFIWENLKFNTYLVHDLLLINLHHLERANILAEKTKTWALEVLTEEETKGQSYVKRESFKNKDTTR